MPGPNSNTADRWSAEAKLATAKSPEWRVKRDAVRAWQATLGQQEGCRRMAQSYSAEYSRHLVLDEQ